MSRAFIAAVSLAVALCGLPTTPAGERDYSYHYFKERRPLELDVTRVAVLGAADEKSSGAPQPDLTPYGLDESAIAPMAVRGWRFIPTREPVRTDTAIERMVSQVADRAPLAFVSPVFLDEQGEPVVITPYLLVGFDRRLEPSRVEAILDGSGAGAIVDRDWANMNGAYRLKSAARDGFAVLEAANALARRPEVTFAEPDMLATAHLEWIPDDPYFPYLWALQNDGTFGASCALPGFDMDAPEAWDITTGDPSILVVVLDSGVQPDHPDLNLYTPGFDATGDGGGGAPVNACDNHGTWVAGYISASIDNTIGIVGVAPGVRSTSARMFVSNLTCDSGGVIQSSWVVDALAWAESIGARITNSSWHRNSPSSAIGQKFADTRANGMVHFGAAGNTASSTIVYPASLPSVNAVAALDPCGVRAWFSNYGTGLAFSAPGHYGITTDRTGVDGGNDGIDDGACLPDGVPGCSSDADCGVGQTCFLVPLDYHLVAGTSMATPHAAGVAALMLSANPSLSADAVEAYLAQSSADLGPAGYDTDYGWGFVNAWDAVQRALADPGAPGGIDDLQVTDQDPITGNLSLSYTPACGSTSHDIYSMPLDRVSTYGWSASTCGIGDTGEYSGFNPGPGSYAFVLVGNEDRIQGSFGTNDLGAQRPAADSSFCSRTQLLESTCP